MKVPHIIGADLSKKSIDFASYQLKTHLKVENNFSGYLELIRWFKQQKINVPKVMIVMENTGLYGYQLEQFLHEKHIRFTKVSGLAIKRSMGLVRGKSDKKDAYRISAYGFEKINRLAAAKPTDKLLQRMQILHSTRERLVKSRASLLNAVKEYQHGYKLEKTDIIIAAQVSVIKTLDQEILKLDKEIEGVVNQEKALTENFQLLQTIKGVGKVLATATIIKTGNFKSFTNARKFACFCGTAPFENTSGTSIRGRTQVSKLRDKGMKKLLDLAAKSAIQHDKELREYYLRQTQNGKSKMNTINVVRNKILYRMFAVIKRQTPFIENYLQVA